jgi:hypothetical protein
MSITAIDGVSSARPANKAYELYAASLAEQPSPTQDFSSPFQQMMAMLMQNLLGGAGQSTGNGSGYGNSYGNDYGQPGGIGGTPGLGAPSFNGVGGGNSLQGLLSSLQELLQALAPLLQALGGNGMQPNGPASDVGSKLDGSAGGGGGMPWDQAPAPAPDPAPVPLPPPPPPVPAPAPSSSAPPSSAPSGSAPSSSTPVSASSRPGPVLPPHAGEVEVNKPIIVGPGETFDGKNQLFRAGRGLNGGGTAESQAPMFIVAPGGTIKNVQFDGRNGGQLLGDGIHLMGDAKVENVHAVHGGPDDMITIDGPGNRARDAQLAGLDAKSIPSGPATVEITNSSFRHSHDKAIQINGDANLKMNGIYADDVGQLAVTLGGKPITAHVSIEDSTLNGVRSHTFRFDSRNSTLDIRNVDTDNGRIQVMAGDPSKVSGATTVMASTDPA